jgi:hypothetical protein
VGGHLLIGGVDVRLVAMRLAHRGGQVVGHHDLGQTTHGLKGVHMSGDPRGQILGGHRLPIQVVRGAHHRHEQLRVHGHLAGAAVIDGQALAGEVDEQLLAGPVLLAHHHIHMALPSPIAQAELGVAVTV